MKIILHLVLFVASFAKADDLSTITKNRDFIYVDGVPKLVNHINSYTRISDPSVNYTAYTQRLDDTGGLAGPANNRKVGPTMYRLEITRDGSPVTHIGEFIRGAHHGDSYDDTLVTNRLEKGLLVMRTTCSGTGVIGYSLMRFPMGKSSEQNLSCVTADTKICAGLKKLMQSNSVNPNLAMASKKAQECIMTLNQLGFAQLQKLVLGDEQDPKFKQEKDYLKSFQSNVNYRQTVADDPGTSSEYFNSKKGANDQVSAMEYFGQLKNLVDDCQMLDTHGSGNSGVGAGRTGTQK